MRARHERGLRWSSGRQSTEASWKGEDGFKEGGAEEGRAGRGEEKGTELGLRERKKKRDAGQEIKGKLRSSQH